MTHDICNSLAISTKAKKNRVLSQSHPIEDVNVLHDDLCDKKKVSLKPATSEKIIKLAIL